MINNFEKVQRIKDAIEHCKEVCNSDVNCDCKAEHEELAIWLKELLSAKYLTKSGKIIQKYVFEPGERILVNNIGESWIYREFSNMDGNRFACTDGKSYYYALPYNENTKHLINKYEMPKGEQCSILSWYD